MEKGAEVLAGLVRWVRGERVILDADLARLYGVETRALNRAVRRNVKRFPPDFMFMLVNGEVTNLKCQIGISSSGWGGRGGGRGRLSFHLLKVGPTAVFYGVLCGHRVLPSPLPTSLHSPPPAYSILVA